MEDLFPPLFLYPRRNANDELLRYLPDNGSRAMVVVGVTMVVAASMFVAARMASQYALRRGLRAEDWVILASLVMSLSQTALQCVQVRYGWGKHAHDLPPDYLRVTLKVFYLSQNGYKLSITLTKISILLLYLRIFPLLPLTHICRVLILTIAGFGVGTTCGTIFQCTPIPRAWDHSIKGRCINKEAFWLADNIFFIITDLILLVLPMPVINSLRLPWRTKVGLVVVFGIGGCTCVASVLRLTTLEEAAAAVDPTWNIIPTSYWSCIETNLGIICACLPVLKAPLAVLFPHLFSSRPSPDPSDEENSPGNLRKRPSIFRDPFPTSTIRGEELGIVTLNDRRDGFRGYNTDGGPTTRLSVPRGDGAGLGFTAKGIYEAGRHDRGGSEERILGDGEIEKMVGISVHVVESETDVGGVGMAR